MAHFKTAYLQREVVMDVLVMKDLKVGDLVAMTPDTDGITPKSITAAASASDADYIVAQSDFTMSKRDYSTHEFIYSDVVKASTVDKKKVALFPVYESDDIILTGNETK